MIFKSQKKLKSYSKIMFWL